ncbi:alpha/beta hydrolase family esterase [Roseovarius aestuariivivens]|uniref:alpha/beta hydrolase family esterase n=1 Tax=Roseovarius aestuariivivens TaxID=1888910 RepID=UPI0010816634|nr:PHB depolymerase family esterase [Roseovarius aestuariivivens]
MRFARAARLAICLLITSGPVHAACGTPDRACELPGGSYHAALPATPGGAPVVLFLHGHGSSGRNAISLARMVSPLTARGYAVLAPDALPRDPDGDGPRSWNFYPGMTGRDEARFFEDLLSDAATRFGIDPARVLLAGFSAGGFMVNYLACATPQSFAAYAPVAGGFWRPHPETCTGPVRLFHTHGWRDETVPLEGRRLGSFHQGDIFAGLEVWRAANTCPDQKPTGFGETGPFLRRAWQGCAAESALELALFPGGHTVPDGWADMVADWFEALN